MKEFLNELNFTKKSLIFIGAIFLFAIGLICIKIGFNNSYNFTLSLILISFLFVSYLIYLIIVLCLYYKLPKNKDKSKMGVLFYINTHGNFEDYKTLTEKFCERFAELSNNIETNIIKPIILTQKQVSVVKDIENQDTQQKLLKKTHCLFGVFMKATDSGKNSDEYELQMNAMLIHPHLNKNLHRIFENNFNYIFKDLNLSTLSKSNDLKNLKALSTQLYYVCQLIYGVANEYLGHFEYAIQLYRKIIDNVEKDQTKFYKLLTFILHNELCLSVICLCGQEYDNYVYYDKYNKEKIKKCLDLMAISLTKTKNPDFEMSFHLAKAVYHLLCDNLIESKGEISILSNNFSKTPPNLRPWLYSEAFLTACENNPKKYWNIDKKYKQLKNNISQEPKKMYDFTFTYYSSHTDNLGIKIALILLVYYRKELPLDILPKGFKEQVIQELESQNLNNFANHLKNLIKE